MAIKRTFYGINKRRDIDVFSSNQKFIITGSMDQIKTVLKFAFKLNGEDEHISQSEYDRGCRIIYQISEDGKYYCLGSFLWSDCRKMRW